MGFMNSTTSFVICEADGNKFDAGALRRLAFSPSIGTDNMRQGWVGLGDPLDDAFSVGLDGGSIAGFSLRVDTRKPSSAAIKIKLAEKIREEEAAGKKVSASRKKELREVITAKLTAKTEFLPTLTDFLWLLDKNRILVGLSSLKGLDAVAEFFQRTFGFVPAPITPQKDMAAFFGDLCRKGCWQEGGYSLSVHGSATLASPQAEEEKATVAVQNNMASVANALDEGFSVQKLRLVGETDALPDMSFDFSLDTSLVVSGLKLPKAEKGMERDADFLLKANVCVMVVDMVEKFTAIVVK